MKKRTFIVAAMLAAMTINANAQENLASGKTATASSEQDTFTAEKAVDGIDNGGSRWAFSGENKDNIADENSFYFQVDLTGEDGKTVDFNSVQIVWENNHVKKFNILTSNDGKEWNVAYEQTEVTDNSGTKSYDFETQNARYIRLKATEIDTYFSFFEFRVFNKQTSALTTVKPSVPFIELNKETEVALKYFDQYGDEMTVENAGIAVEGGTYNDGKLTATESGKVTFTVTVGGHSVEASVYAVSDAPALDITNYDCKGIYGAEELNILEKAGWSTPWNNEGINIVGEMTLGNTPVLQVGNLQKILFGKLNESGGTDVWDLTNTDGYTDAKIALFPDRDVTAEFNVEGGQSSGKVQLKGGEWNYVTASGFTADNTINYFDVLCDAVDGEYPSMLISNIYLQKAKDGALIIDRTVTSENKFLKVSGNVTADNKSELESTELADVTAFDLSGVTFAENVGVINFANKNAMIQVAGTHENDVVTLSDNAKAIEGTRNMIVKDGSYYFPVAKLELTDGDLAYTDFFVSTGSTGYSYTRTVNAGQWISIASPIEGMAIPAGLTVYGADTDNCDNETLAFKKVETIEKGVPYLAYATTDVTLEGEATGDLNLTSDFINNSSLGSATFNATFASVKGSEGNYYGIFANASGNDEKTLTLQKLGNEAQLGSFRAYIALPAAANVSAYRVLVNNGIETSIYSIKANGGVVAADGVYSIDGRLVKKGTSAVGLAKGVYVINGKKYVVK